MKRSLWTQSATFAGLIAAAALVGPVSTEPRALASPRATNTPVDVTIPQEPVLFFDVSGYGIGGAIHQRISVYNNGLASISMTDATGGAGNAAFTYVPIDRVQALQSDLFNAGAHELPDNPFFGADAPLTTVTFFRGRGPDLRAHTFNFYFTDGDEGYTQVSLLIYAFIAETFPNFFEGSGGN